MQYFNRQKKIPEFYVDHDEQIFSLQLIYTKITNLRQLPDLHSLTPANNAKAL